MEETSQELEREHSSKVELVQLYVELLDSRIKVEFNRTSTNWGRDRSAIWGPWWIDSNLDPGRG